MNARDNDLFVKTVRETGRKTLMHAPIAFVIAAVLMGLTAASFAALGSRMPVSASEAAYARAAFGSVDWHCS